MSNPTAKKTMAELLAIGLVTLGEIESQQGSLEKQITLKDEFDWFLSSDFQSVRNLPPYYSRKTIPDDEQGGYFSYTYAKQVLLNSVLPRTDRNGPT